LGPNNKELNMAAKKLWSLNALALELNRNFRTISRALERVKPDAKVAGRPRWYMSTAVAALDAHVRATGREPDKVVERFDPTVEAQIHAVEVTGADVDKLLAQLRAEPMIDRRRKLIEQRGRCVGAHERALQVTVGEGVHAPLRQTYIDKMLGDVLGEVMSLCEWLPALGRDREPAAGGEGAAK
jgi:hypothetical protein